MRNQPPLKLERSPLVFVLSQVRFPALLSMEEHIAAIQAGLRKEQFTRFSQESIQEVTFAKGEIKTGLNTRWAFPNRRRTEAVILAPAFLVYETSDYDVFETFVARFSSVLDVVAAATNIDFVEQVGLRYLDLIRPAAGFAASDFLREQVRGFSSDDLGVKVVGHHFMTQAQTESGELYIRSFEKSGPGFMPPDLISTHLEFKPDPEQLANETYRVLDIDHIAKGEIEFASAPLEKTLWDLHDVSSAAFRAAVTEEAMDFWKKEE